MSLFLTVIVDANTRSSLVPECAPHPPDPLLTDPARDQRGWGNVEGWVPHLSTHGRQCSCGEPWNHSLILFLLGIVAFLLRSAFRSDRCIFRKLAVNLYLSIAILMQHQGHLPSFFLQ